MFLAMVVLAAVCYFAIMNAGETVNITITRGLIYENVPLMIALFAAFALGAVIVFVLSLFRDVVTRSQLSRLRKENSRLAEELAALRNLPLEEGPPEEKTEGGRDQAQV